MLHQVLAAFAVLTLAVVGCAEAQESGQPLELGASAPDFELPGATRYGVLANPVKLSDFKGKTVVLAFFFKARTSG
jgi:cytochrome oxidase Cu insertion factor (SCO1/SenC/PrrC family)